MLWNPTDGGLAVSGGTTASSNGTSVTGSGTAHTKGSWTTLVDPVPWPAAGIWINHKAVVGAATIDSSTLLDLGIAVSGGGAGTETVIAADMAIGFYTGARSFYLPLSLPAGVRLSARLQSAVTSKAVQVQAVVVGGGFLPGDAAGRATTYGADTAASSGVLLTLPATTNTKGAWTAISASTTNPMKWMAIFITNEPTTAAGGTTHLVDVGAGGSGSEQVIVPNIQAANGNSETFNSGILTVPANLPAGSRLVARYAAGNVTAGNGNRPALTIVGLD